MTNALPAKSFTPEAPLLIVAVYTVEPESAADGVKCNLIK